MTVFITNNFDWIPQSVCDLYRRRWDIEVFFKQAKQSLKPGSFLGHSANVVKWQVYTAPMVYVLLRCMAHLSEWGHSSTRLTVISGEIVGKGFLFGNGLEAIQAVAASASLQSNRTMRSLSIPGSHQSQPDAFALVIPSCSMAYNGRARVPFPG